MKEILDMGKIVISVFVEEDVKRKLKKLSKSEKRSMSQMASVLLDEALENREKQQEQNH